MFALRSLMEDVSTTGELAEEMNISFSSATSLVDRLVKNGWVTRDLDLDDRRVTRLGVTSEAKELIKKHKVAHYKLFAHLLDALPKGDVESLKRILANMEQALEKEKTKHAD
jgi:DNA-binding MarR family transcriptional regulator